MFKKITLKNGLRIITVSDKGTEAVTVLALIGTGSKYETKEINGISHFLEHMYFKGTKKRPSKIAVVEMLDKIGGIYNAFTGEEYTGYFAKVSADQLEVALDWVSDIYLNSLLPKKEIEKEKGVLIEEINMISDTPMLYIGDLWKKVLYGDQPAGWDIAGSKENIAKITRAQIVDYMRSQYVAANTIVCVAGNIREDYAVGIVKKYFSKIKTAKFGNKAPVIEKQISPQVLILPKETDQTHLALGVRAYNIFHVDKYVLDLLETILGGMMSSRLFLEVREKLGAAYYIKTNVESDPDTGYLSTFAGIDNRKLDKAILTILREYKKISQQKINLDELKKAKDNIKGKLALTLESSDAQAFFYAGQEILEKNILTPAEICKRIDKVTANDILKVAKDIFRPEKLNLALIGPFEDKSRFIKLLKF